MLRISGDSVPGPQPARRPAGGPFPEAPLGPSKGSPESSASSASSAPDAARRRRDRRGRGLRGPVMPQELPAWRSRAERFDDQVLDALERLERRWSRELGEVEFAVEDVPPADPAPWEHDEVPLGRLFPAQGTLPPRIVLYRRPIESRAEDPHEVAMLVHTVVVEQVAHLLALTPEQVDPLYRGD